MTRDAMRLYLLALSTCLFVLFSSEAQAQNRKAPYWASMRADKVNMRVGPSVDYQIDWVYKRKGLPVKVIRLRNGWRLIRDPDGAQGWVAARLLNPARSAIVTGTGLADMRAEASGKSKLKWRLEPGVVGALGECENRWCAFEVAGHRGFVRADRLWGTGQP